MDETEQKKPPTQVCSIRIMFPVESDEQGIEYKKKIYGVLVDIPQARIEFSLMSRPPLMPNGS
ncbi:unnamed protein product [marine sediment metagenome]|uniref:Uncharacterized protein n=1 Tax=marine sediment metagenome TaxID=412755 RepID=X1QBF0_9ZZZZ